MSDTPIDPSLSLSALLNSRSIRAAVVVFIIGRVLIGVWGALVVSVMPQLAPEDEFLRMLGGGAPAESEAGLLWEPWQRFDTMHYLNIARDGYEAQNSVFPPLYPLAIRGLGAVLALAPGLDGDLALLAAALAIANGALLLALALLHHLTARVLDHEAASRTLAYLLFFPAGFFLFAGYTESLFLLWALASVIAARRGANLWWAGFFGLLAGLTRLTGWLLVVPLAYEYARRRGFDWRQLDWRRLDRRALGVALPLLGTAAFLLWRAAAGLPPLSQVYEQYWFQRTAFPGLDVLVALRVVFTGSGPRAGEYSLWLDLASLLLILVTTALAFRRLGTFYGLYGLALLFFMLLPTSAVKPLYSFSRYTLAFFPLFMLLGAAGRRPLLNRLILYPSFVLYLFFSGQFFMGGWVG